MKGTDLLLPYMGKDRLQEAKSEIKTVDKRAFYFRMTTASVLKVENKQLNIANLSSRSLKRTINGP